MLNIIQFHINITAENLSCQQTMVVKTRRSNEVIWTTAYIGSIEGYITKVTKSLHWKTQNGRIILEEDEV